MTCSNEVIGSIAVFRLEGEMDLYTSSQLKSAFEEMKGKGFTNFIVDCTELSYLDSSGVGVLISVFTTAHRMKAGFFLCGVTGTVKTVIEFTKLTNFLPIVESFEEALKRLQGEEGSEGQRGALDGGKQIFQSDDHPLLEREGMFHKDFHIDLKKVRYLSQLIVQKAPSEIRDFNLLEQQISELIKNGIRHGNKNDPNKRIGIWFKFSKDYAHIIVEDEGEGFHNVSEWNQFYLKKRDAFEQHDFDAMMKYVSFRTEDSNDNDGGNALFAAVEFWNEGVVFSKQGNCVAAKRSYTS
jgi:serine/threonine-protein kinase RsbW